MTAPPDAREKINTLWCSCGVARVDDGKPCKCCGDPEPPTPDEPIAEKPAADWYWDDENWWP